jgi:hypothetical protein
MSTPEEVATRLAVHEAVCAERQSAIMRRLDWLTYLMAGVIVFLLFGKGDLSSFVHSLIAKGAS